MLLVNFSLGSVSVSTCRYQIGTTSFRSDAYSCRFNATDTRARFANFEIRSRRKRSGANGFTSPWNLSFGRSSACRTGCAEARSTHGAVAQAGGDAAPGEADVVLPQEAEIPPGDVGQMVRYEDDVLWKPRSERWRFVRAVRIVRTSAVPRHVISIFVPAYLMWAACGCLPFPTLRPGNSLVERPIAVDDEIVPPSVLSTQHADNGSSIPRNRSIV